MRVAFIRSVDLGQASPYLEKIREYAKEKNIELKLFYTDGICNQQLFPGEYEKVQKNISCEELVKKIIDWKPNYVISISVPDDNSLRDACIKEKLMHDYNIPMIMHPLKSTFIMCNKDDTNRIIRKLGYKVPKSVFINSDLLKKRVGNYSNYNECIYERVRDLKFPIIVKPLWDSMSCGMKIIDDYEHFRKFLENESEDCDILVEEFIDGELFGIEVVGRKNEYRCQPLVKKCNGNSRNLFPFDHLRFGPFKDKNYNGDMLEKMVINIAEALEIEGSIEVELMYKDGDFYIIEINPRVSGMTVLSSSISGYNTYECLLKMITGDWSKEYNIVGKTTFSAEFPLENVNEKKLRKLRGRKDVVHITECLYHDGRKQYRMILNALDEDECYEKIQNLKNNYEIIPENIVDEIQNYVKTKNRGVVKNEEQKRKHFNYKQMA